MSEDLVERSEAELSWAGLAVAETIRAGEVAVIGLGALLVCPPLLILAVVVLVPAVALAVAAGAIVAAIALPVYAVRHAHRHRGPSAHARVHRLAQLGRADAALAGSRLRRLAHRTLARSA